MHSYILPVHSSSVNIVFVYSIIRQASTRVYVRMNNNIVLLSSNTIVGKYLALRKMWKGPYKTTPT